MIYKTKLQKIYRPDWTVDNIRKSNKLWLDKNENNDEILLKQTKKMLKNIDKSTIFSYPNLAPIYKKLARLLKISPKKILLSAGSDAGIKTVFETFVNEKDKVLRTNPTFAMYKIYSKIFNTKEIIIDYKKTDDGPRLELKKILNIITKSKPKLICLPNSDSPTGHSFSKDEIKKILLTAKKANSFVLIDEAYYPFYPNSALRFIQKYNNLIITRTTAKAWGIAGLRVGYVLSSKRNIEEMHKVRPMYEINNLGAELFKIYISKQSIMKKSVERLLEGKKYFRNELKKLGFKVFKREDGNFVHVNFMDRKKEIIKKLSKRIYFRHSENHKSIKGFSRFSITSKKNFYNIIKIIKQTIN
tara:strand:+ start:5345 stop:6418 length:1074 start_codon:yes stop_codon:yes gene_type:complete